MSSYVQNNSNGEPKPQQTLETSAKFISAYLKFDMKKDLQEVISPLVQELRRTNTILDKIAGGRSG